MQLGRDMACFVLISRGVVETVATDPYPICFFTYLKFSQQLILKSYLKTFYIPKSRMGGVGKGVGVATGIYPVLYTLPITLKLTIRWALLVPFYTF